jgi:hypothetical protein
MRPKAPVFNALADVHCFANRAIGHVPLFEPADMIIPDLSSSIAVAPLTAWMLALAIKHVIADFFLQTNWMAQGKDRPTGWLVPLTVHCAIHGVIATALIVAIQPRLWFIGVADFVVHFLVDRWKGFCVNTFSVTPHTPWFWWLIGIDQALHHLTNFAWALLLVVNR